MSPFGHTKLLFTISALKFPPRVARSIFAWVPQSVQYMYLWIRETYTDQFQLKLTEQMPNVFPGLALPSARIQHDGPWPRHVGDDGPLGAVHRHGADALIDVVTVVDSLIDPVVSNAIRGAEI